MSHERRMLLVGGAVLLAALGAAAVVALTVIGTDADQRRAVAFAAVVAGGGAVTGWIVARQGRGGVAAVAVAGGMAATLARMLPLLVAVAWLIGRDRATWARLAAGLLVVFHLVLLVTDMVLNSLADRWANRPARSPENGSSAGAEIAN